MSDERIRAAAEALCAARVARRPVEPLPDAIRPQDESEAYRVQAVLHELLTEAGWGEVAGHKIGCTTPVMQQLLGLDHPVSGGIFAATVRRGGSIDLRLADFLDLSLESEIALRLDRDLPASGAPYDRAGVAAAVGAAYAAFELTEDRYAPRDAVGIPTHVADDYYSIGSVLADPVEDVDPFTLDRVASRLLVNGEEVGTGTGSLVLGHPLEALAWLANSVASRGGSLRAGEFVSLGSVIGGYYPKPGDDVRVVHEPLGEVRIRFT
jgi:2-oxo-3-hexenedioate decarboxylase/2-keto-4-pentenoate hydratase